MNRQRSSQTLKAKPGISPPPPPPDNFDENKNVRRAQSNRGLSKSNQHHHHLQPKNQKLDKYREQHDDEIFGKDEMLEPIDLDLDNEFQTLKLQDIPQFQQFQNLNSNNSNNHNQMAKSPPKSPQRTLQSPNKKVQAKSRNQSSKAKPIDSYDDEFELESEEPFTSPQTNRHAALKQENVLKLSPDKNFVVTSSPKSHRISLSEYSEEGEEGDKGQMNDTETEVTSNLNEEDFEDIDNIFGDEESGIYSSNGKNKFQTILKAQQLKLQNDAEIEERELMKKYHRIKQKQQSTFHKHGSNHDTNEISTLKLKKLDQDLDPFGTLKQDQPLADHDNTINYEYTRDDYENFEDGFEVEDYGQKLKLKKSMPNVKFRTSASLNQLHSQLNDFGNPKIPMKKFKSTYNLPGERNQLNPKLDNKTMKKLNRIPSFSNHQRLTDMLEQNETFKLTKQQLLQQYQEIDMKHKQTNDRILTMRKSMSVPGSYGQHEDGNNGNKSNMKHSLSTRGGHVKKHGKAIGLVRYLNEVPNAPNSNMKYNHDQKVWEGNDIELLKFNNNLKKPSLIKLQDYVKKYKTNNQGENEEGGMVFDPNNLRWVSKTGEEEEDIFKDLNDGEEGQYDVRLDESIDKDDPRTIKYGTVGVKSIPQIKHHPSLVPSISNLNSRGVSTFTARTASSTNLSSRKSSAKKGGGVEPNHQYETGNDYLISKRNIDRFLKEEAKISKKVQHWFNHGEVYQVRPTVNDDPTFRMDYYWDIRNLVIDNNDNNEQQ